MKVIVAKNAGFCFGVKRAIKIAFQTLEKGQRPVYTLGPIIHNPQMVSRLEEMGLTCVDDLRRIKRDRGTIVIRSHGISPHMLERMREAGLQLVDATCPFVKKLQKYVEILRKENYKIVIVGDAEHPEVQALRGYGGAKTLVIKDAIDLRRIGAHDRIGLVAQTTLLFDTFLHAIKVLLTRAKEIKVYNTICEATLKRQESAVALAQKVDVMIVIGGKNSGNTNRLAEICAATGKPTYHIETYHELNPQWFRHKRVAGITAGASTPDWIIAEVQKALQKL